MPASHTFGSPTQDSYQTSRAMEGQPIPGGHAVVPGYPENGRLYGDFKKGQYMFPIDELEKDRLDMFHHLFLLARNQRLFSAPFPNQESPRILDLGCGTGIWAIDMQDKYPVYGRVVGVDLALIQPEYIPEHLQFDRMDIEEPWLPKIGGDYDLIHLRTMNGSISNWPFVYDQIYKHLKPQVGFVEQVEFNWVPRSDDRSLPENSYFLQWARLLERAMEAAGRPIDLDGQRVEQQMTRAGLVDFHEEVIKVPINGWPEDPHAREIGRWFNLGLTQGLDALTLAPFTRVLGYPPEQARDLISHVKEEIRSRKIRAYCTLHIFTGRRLA
ncbi:S-adenosyl-L-methionine-dependent methyltransferase [Sordaria brevicollis]|uniref:S-adenosyl-L-methionine-dependent methyltransferase n=1 Tax=Sordaria brevicollis TaxID=83679 RepID=A0AAE0P909_SORBR|nr:S-adenosyl-L-methionine-dependent methyltransferase [Sordaria brevicollis]